MVFRAIDLRTSERNEMETGERSNRWNRYENGGRSTRYEFPKFDGDGFEGWMMRAEYFFQVAKVPEEEKVRVAAIHLEGKALQWHRGFESLHGDIAYANWPSYSSSLAARFGAHAYEDPLADLRNLKQKGTLQDYMDTFDELYPRAGIREDQALSYFLSGLIDDFQRPVRMFRPKTLSEAYALAKLQELTINVLGRDRIKQYENEVDYSTKEWKLVSEMEDETYADEEIDLDVEIDVDQAIADEDLKETMDANSSSYCNIDFEQLECNRSPVQKTEELELSMSLSHKWKPTEASGGEIDHDQVMKSKESEQARQNEPVNELSVELPISVCYSRSLSWLLNWFPRPTVKLKFVAQRGDELYAGFDDHSNVFFWRGGFSISDARGHSGIQRKNEYTLVEMQPDQRSGEQRHDLFDEVFLMSDFRGHVFGDGSYPLGFVVPGVSRGLKSSLVNEIEAYKMISRKSPCSKRISSPASLFTWLKEIGGLGHVDMGEEATALVLTEVIMVSLVMKMKFLTSLANWVFDGGGNGEQNTHDTRMVQWCLQCFITEASEFNFVAAIKYYLNMAMHQYECCVLHQFIIRSIGEFHEKLATTNLVAKKAAIGLLFAPEVFELFHDPGVIDGYLGKQIDLDKAKLQGVMRWLGADDCNGVFKIAYEVVTQKLGSLSEPKKKEMSISWSSTSLHLVQLIQFVQLHLAASNLWKMLKKLPKSVDNSFEGVERVGWFLASSYTSSRNKCSLRRLSIRFPKPMVKMKLMKFASRVGFEEETLNSIVSFSEKNGTDFASAGRVGTDSLLGKSIPILEADSHETVAAGESTGSSSVRKKAYQLSDIDWLMLNWFPQPNVKMKHEKLGSEIREAWLRDSLWARNLKGKGLLRSQIVEEVTEFGIGVRQSQIVEEVTEFGIRVRQWRVRQWRVRQWRAKIEGMTWRCGEDQLNRRYDVSQPIREEHVEVS